MTTTLTPRERELARHALGLPNEKRRSYRNRYYVGADTPTGRQWCELVARDLAILVRAPKVLCDHFHLTRAGAEAVLEAGETLDEEDFPK